MYKEKSIIAIVFAVLVAVGIGFAAAQYLAGGAQKNVVNPSSETGMEVFIKDGAEYVRGSILIDISTEEADRLEAYLLEQRLKIRDRLDFDQGVFIVTVPDTTEVYWVEKIEKEFPNADAWLDTVMHAMQ